MENPYSRAFKRTIQHQFDSFCRKILRGEVSNCNKEMARWFRNRVLFSELSATELNLLSTIDAYSMDDYRFQVMDYEVEVKNALIGEALAALSEKKRIIVLLFYFLDMSDAEIGKLMHLVRSTIYRHRTSTLQQIKTYMEGNVGHES